MRRRHFGMVRFGVIAPVALLALAAILIAGAEARMRAAPHRRPVPISVALRPASRVAPDPVPEPDPPTSIPPLASIAGVRVGYDGMDRLEQRFGPGRVITGGHPQGARIWNVRRSGWSLYADGFNGRDGSPDRGYVVDSFRLTRGREDAPLTKACGGSFVVWPGIALDMTRTQVLALLTRRQVAYEISGDSVNFQARGFVRLTRGEICTTWRAEIDFRGGRMSEVSIDPR